MKQLFKRYYTHEEIKEVHQNIGFLEFDNCCIKVIDDIYVKSNKLFKCVYLNIYVRDRYYGGITIDISRFDSNKYGLIISAYKIMLHSHIDAITLSNLFPELEEQETFILTENMIKKLVITQLRKSFPMAEWPEPAYSF